MVIAYIGLGSNLGARLNSIDKALQHLSQIVEITGRSRTYESEPFYRTYQPRYLNQVVRVQSALPAAELLEKMLSIETILGRVRGEERWHSRTMDLDLLYYGQEIMDTPALILPHPRIQERPFVLLPLEEIAPDFICPRTHRSIQDMAAIWRESKLIWLYGDESS